MAPENGLPSASGAPQYRRVGKYEVLAHIATGGMGAVYKAKDVELGREVALKILPPDLAARPAVLERFRREARHAARLRHENIVTLYEFGEDHGVYFLAMELVPGVDLHEYIVRKGRVKPEKARRILLQCARALDHYHQAGIVHRDIKPSNFLISRPHGKLLVKLTDLGLAIEASDDEFRVTREGSTVGSVDYMAPEQARDSRAADIRSDIYSLGCTFFEMLTGRAPFAEGTLTERVLKHLEAEPPDVRELNPAVSEELARVLRRMLAKRPPDRYQNPADLIEDLEQAKRAPAEEEESRPAEAEPGAAAPPRTPGAESDLEVSPAAPTPHDGVRAPRPGRRRRPASSPAELPTVSPERRRTAASQFERAAEALAIANHDYAIQLLLSCCKLDPFMLKYRKALRRAEKAKHQGDTSGGPLAWLRALLRRARMRKAQRSGDHLTVLALGEELLARNPWDVGAQLEMAGAADDLGLLELGIWLLEEARSEGSKDLRVFRHLARLYEKRGDFPEAIALWEKIRKADPTDMEAGQKILDLAASDTIRRGRYAQQETER